MSTQLLAAFRGDSGVPAKCLSNLRVT